MKASEAKLLEFLKKSSQFVIPIYQRSYSWEEKQCRQLWDDILRAGSSDDIAVHFIGSIVYIEQGLSQVTHQAPMLIIDGQQRLTTISLLLEALARTIGNDYEPVDGFSAPKIREYYLTNRLEKRNKYFKLLLSRADDATLKTIIQNIEYPIEASIRVTQNFELFQVLLKNLKGDYHAVCSGLAKLVVVDIALSRDQDNPQLIFESMNSTGKELSQADLIRNFVLMGLDHDLQSELYEKYWRPMEVEFGQEAYGAQFDNFMRHFLTVRTGEIPREREVYEAFKEYSRTKPVRAAGSEALVKEIRTIAGYFCAMALGRESDPSLAAAFGDLRELRVDVAYPLLLEMYDDYVKNTLNTQDFVAAIRLIESYIFRRTACGIPAFGMNVTFSSFGKALDKARYLDSVKAHFLLLASARRFPDDNSFRHALYSRDFYNFRSRNYCLRRLENFGRKEPVSVAQYSVEHILPQNPDLPLAWRDALGPDWQNVHAQWLHTLGNITLTGYNSEYRDLPFDKKRDMSGGFSASPLALNAGLGQLRTWNEVTIRERGRRLAIMAVDVWPAPQLDAITLARHRPSRNLSSNTYSILDHPHLGNSKIRTLFEALRSEILSIDPSVREEFYRPYIAYKAETNFVDVVPQARRLKLSLNMPFSEIVDPLGLCRDVTQIGHYGNGDVEVGMQSVEELSYIIDLIRQSFERQIN